MMRKLVIPFLFLFTTSTSISSTPILDDLAIHLVSERLGKLERFVFLYSVTRPASKNQKNQEMKKLVLMGRDNLKYTKRGDITLRVQEEFYWFGDGRMSKNAPAHTLGFSNGLSSYSWIYDNGYSNGHKSKTPSYVHTQVPPSIYGFVESLIIYPIPNLLREVVKSNSFENNPNAFILEEGLLTISIPILMGTLNAEIKFHVKKGLKSTSIKNRPLGNFVVDEFLQVKEDIWVPKSGRLVQPNKAGRPVTKIEVLKVLVNEDVNSKLFKNFPWDNPKYNTSNNRISNVRKDYVNQLKDHPPSYYTSFFDMSLEEAHQLYLQIE